MQTLSIMGALQGEKEPKFVVNAGVCLYLNFLLLPIQPIKYIDFQLLPEIESIHLQARSSLQPLLHEKHPMIFITTLTLLGHRLAHPERILQKHHIQNKN